MKIIDGGVTAAKGFKAAAAAAEIKYKGRTDMAMVYSEVPCVAAGTFTTNVVKAAPVKWDQDIVYNHPSAQVVICNSGIANACTGAEGYGYCKETAAAAADISAQSTAVWPACGWTIWRSSMWVVPAVESAAPCQLRKWSRSMSRTCPRRSSGIWPPTGRGWRKMSPIWTACGVSCTAVSTPPSGAERSRKPRHTICGRNIFFEINKVFSCSDGGYGIISSAL